MMRVRLVVAEKVAAFLINTQLAIVTQLLPVAEQETCSLSTGSHLSASLNRAVRG